MKEAQSSLAQSTLPEKTSLVIFLGVFLSSVLHWVGLGACLCLRAIFQSWFAPTHCQTGFRQSRVREATADQHHHFIIFFQGMSSNFRTNLWAANRYWVKFVSNRQNILTRRSLSRWCEVIFGYYLRYSKCWGVWQMRSTRISRDVGTLRQVGWVVFSCVSCVSARLLRRLCQSEVVQMAKLRRKKKSINKAVPGTKLWFSALGRPL